MVKTFSCNEIVCLKHQNKSLYCEVIDIIISRSMGWFRPVMLVNFDEDNVDFQPIGKVDDLRFSSDLLWHLDLFSPVLDTEYITFFSQLKEPFWNEEKSVLARKKLRYFLEEFCQKSRS